MVCGKVISRGMCIGAKSNGGQEAGTDADSDAGRNPILRCSMAASTSSPVLMLRAAVLAVGGLGWPPPKSVESHCTHTMCTPVSHASSISRAFGYAKTESTAFLSA